MPLTANKDRQNMWDVPCAWSHALCKVCGTRVLRCHMCHAQAQACPSMGWAMGRCFAWTFGTVAVLVQGERGGGGNELFFRCTHQNTPNFPQTVARKEALHVLHPYIGGVPCAVRALCEKLAVLHHREFGKFRRLKGRH